MRAQDASQDEKKTAIFHVHLATLVVMMFVSGTLMTLNMHGTRVGVLRENAAQTITEVPVRVAGWPFPARHVEMVDASMVDGPCIESAYVSDWDREYGIPTDLIVGLVILLASAVVFEHILRRWGSRTRTAPRERPTLSPPEITRGLRQHPAPVASRSN